MGDYWGQWAVLGAHRSSTWVICPILVHLTAPLSVYIYTFLRFVANLREPLHATVGGKGRAECCFVSGY